MNPALIASLNLQLGHLVGLIEPVLTQVQQYRQQQEGGGTKLSQKSVCLRIWSSS